METKKISQYDKMINTPVSRLIIMLSVPTIDVVIGGKRSPLMVAAQQTTASLYKCFSGELRKIAYPEMI